MLKNILVLLLLGGAGLVGYVKLWPRYANAVLFDAEETFKLSTSSPGNGRTRRFFIKTPPGFTSSSGSSRKQDSGSAKKWPVVIMIHGFT